MTTTVPASIESAEQVHPAARLSPPLRIAAAATLLLGTGLQAAAWLIWSEPNLTKGYSAVAAGAVRPDLATTLFILGIPFWIGGIAVYVLLGRRRSPRLAWTGGALLVVGFTMLGVNLGTEVMTSFLVHDSSLSPAQADHATRTLTSLPASVMNMAFLVGVGLGIPLTGVSLWRSRAVPRAAAALLVAFLVIDLVGESTAASLSVVAHVISFVAAGWIAIAVVRCPALRPAADARLAGG